MCNASAFVILSCLLFLPSAKLVYISTRDKDLAGETNSLHAFIDQP